MTIPTETVRQLVKIGDAKALIELGCAMLVAATADEDIACPVTEALDDVLVDAVDTLPISRDNNDVDGEEAHLIVNQTADANRRAHPHLEALECAEAILSRSQQISTNCGGRGPSTTTTKALKMVRAALKISRGKS